VSIPGQRASVIRVALAVLNREGWSTESGKNSSGFVLIKEGERLLVVGHGRWEINQYERDQLYGRLLRLYSRHPEASRGVIVLPETSHENLDEVSKDVRGALGVELALVDPSAATMRWFDAPAKRDFVDLDDPPASASKRGVVGRLRRIFR
jgi:hypothetical protein